ncbi:MAG: type II toxin-antitoxin system Phd/YefM family antitoxin [Armatimonadetes bacterium]|nr:type II toxin-antitoxin system Phd/YefM family antitoxin [Armatimonadota bacterium]
MIRATDIHSLTDFTRNAKGYIQKIQETKNPIAITINGNAEVVVQDAQAYQAMVDELEHSRFVAAIREGEKAVRDGQVKDVDQSFSDIREKLGL